MEWWQILIWILALIGLMYGAGFFYCLSLLLAFRKKLSKRFVALSVLYSEKRDILLSLYAVCDAAGVKFESSLKESAAKVRWLKTNILKEEDAEMVALTLDALEKRLFILAQSEAGLRTNADYQNYTSTLRDIDANYRRIIAVYNSDVTGYEYWRKTPLFFIPFWFCGFRKKKRLA